MILEIAIDRQQTQLGVFAAACRPRRAAVRPAIRLAIGGTLLMIGPPSPVSTRKSSRRMSMWLQYRMAPQKDVRDVLEVVDSDAALALTGVPDGLEPRTRRGLVDVALQDLGTGVAVRAWHATDPAGELGRSRQLLRC
jgi:hypothetical protein